MTTETAAIVWAVLATGGAAAVYWLMRRDYDWAIGGWNRACTIHRDEARNLLERATDAERALASYKATEHARLVAHMREIGIRGNQSPKRKRA